jgi:hypothetical protein
MACFSRGGRIRHVQKFLVHWGARAEIFHLVDVFLRVCTMARCRAGGKNFLAFGVEVFVNQISSGLFVATPSPTEADHPPLYCSQGVSMKR